jgi:hypothetical protein
VGVCARQHESGDPLDSLTETEAAYAPAGWVARRLTYPIADEPTAERFFIRPTGRRTWWAHLEFTPTNIKLTILPKKLEDLREAHT